MKELSLHVGIMHGRVQHGIKNLINQHSEELVYVLNYSLNKTEKKYPKRPETDEHTKDRYFCEVIDTFTETRSCYNFDYSIFELAAELKNKCNFKRLSEQLKSDIGEDFEHVLAGLIELKKRPETTLKRFIYLTAAEHFYKEMLNGDPCSFLDITHMLSIDRAISVILEDIAIAKETGKYENANAARTAISNKNKLKIAKEADELIEQILKKIIHEKEPFENLTALVRKISILLKTEISISDPRYRKEKAIEKYLKKSRSWNASNFYYEYRELIK